MQAVSTAAKVAITNVMAALLFKLASSSLRVKSGSYHTPIVVVASSAVDVFRNSLSGLSSVVANMMVRYASWLCFRAFGPGGGGGDSARVVGANGRRAGHRRAVERTRDDEAGSCAWAGRRSGPPSWLRQADGPTYNLLALEVIWVHQTHSRDGGHASMWWRPLTSNRSWTAEQ